MSAKFLNSFTDENPELQRQIGCMTGIFQMFDRQHLLTGRRPNAQSNKRFPSGHSLLTRNELRAENSSCQPHSILAKNVNKSVNEDRRVSMESSRTSFSSSSYSSFSSMDGSKSTQQEPSSNDHSFYSDKSLNHPPKSRTSENEGKLIRHDPKCDPVRLSIQSGRQSLDFRDVVKESIYRDNQALSVKTSIKEEKKRQTMKHKDSPRPLQLSKSIDGSYMNKSRTVVDVDESLRVLVKLREPPPFLSDANEPTRKLCDVKDGSFYPLPKETPRFSYDGRESHPSLNSQDNGKPSSKLRELPRLSLDSRSTSIKSSSFDLKPNSVFKGLDRTNMHRRISVSSDDQPALRSNACSPSVVVKLMGLDAMPNLRLGSQEQAHSKGNHKDKDQENLGTSNLDGKFDQMATLHGNSTKFSVAPRQKNTDLIMKPICNARVPIDVAPWKQQGKIRIPQKTTYGYGESHMKQQPESVNSEKRMKEVEFPKANKGFRALEQILDSIQAKGLLENKRGEDQPSEALVYDPPPGKSKSFMPVNADELSSQIVSTVKKGDEAPKAFNSPIVIMKPAKSVNNASIPPPVTIEGFSSLQRLRTSDPADRKKTLSGNKMIEDRTPKASSVVHLSQPIISKDRKIRKGENGLQKTNSRSSQMSPRMQELPRENIGLSMKTSSSSGPQSLSRENGGHAIRSSNSLSPRIQQRKLDSDKRSRPPLPSAESNKLQKQIPSRHSFDSVSPRARAILKATQAQQNDDQLSDIGSETVSLSHQGDEISQRSESNISLTSQVDIEVTSVDSMEVKPTILQQGCESPVRMAERNVGSVLKTKKSLHSSNKNASVMEPATIAQEQPSPISVLDAPFHQDSLSPPVKKHHRGLKGNENQTSNGNKSTGAPAISSSQLSSRFNQKKLANIENLLEKLRQLSEHNDEAPATDHIASLCKTQNPDDRYVSEILLASGLLMKDLTSEQLDPTQIQLHHLGHPINPDLFLVLEQRKSGWLVKSESTKGRSLKFKSDPEKLHRKLVFDMVNELLIQKLDLATPAMQINSLIKTRNIRFPSGQRLLEELCSDIEKLRTQNSVSDSNSTSTADMLRQSEGWTDFVMELPVVVLEIERLVFKDLIDEVVNGEAATSFQGKANGRRRKLFAK